MHWLDRQAILTFFVFFGILMVSAWLFDRIEGSVFRPDRMGLAAAIALVLTFLFARARHHMRDQ